MRFTLEHLNWKDLALNSHLVLVLSWREHNWFNEMEAAAAANIGWTGYDITVRKDETLPQLPSDK